MRLQSVAADVRSRDRRSHAYHSSRSAYARSARALPTTPTTVTIATATPERWLSVEALAGCELDAPMRSWLTTPGLLTERVRAASGAQFSLSVLAEEVHDGEHRRVILLGTRTQPWIYAETAIPDRTLALQPWLARMGRISLGETLATRDATRSAFAYARLTPQAPLVARALAHTGHAAQPLWVRRSDFFVQGSPLTVQEVFLPGIGSAGIESNE